MGLPELGFETRHLSLLVRDLVPHADQQSVRGIRYLIPVELFVEIVEGFAERGT